MSEQHEEESLRRWSREQAEIERQTDALVLKTLTAMVNAADDLKSKLRRDTESILETYRRTKRGLENEISLAGAERQRLRREAEDERDALLEQARQTAAQIVQDAERERESLLSEVRAMEQRLRGLEAQIRTSLGLSTAEAATEAPASPESAAGGTAEAGSETGAEAAVAPVTPAEADSDADAASVPAEVATGSDAGTVVIPEDVDQAPEAPPTPVTPSTARPAPPAASTGPAPAAAPMPAQPATAPPRQVRLVFAGVPGYEQAAALEEAVSNLVPNDEVETEEFEHGQLVLITTAADVSALAHQLVAVSPSSIQLESAAGDRATFRYV